MVARAFGWVGALLVIAFFALVIVGVLWSNWLFLRTIF